MNYVRLIHNPCALFGFRINTYCNRRIHINKTLKNIRITKNGEDIVTPIKSLDDVNRIPPSENNEELKIIEKVKHSMNESEKDNVLTSSLTKEEQEKIIKSEKIDALNTKKLLHFPNQFHESSKQVPTFTNNDFNIDELILSLSSKQEIDNNNRISSTSFMKQIETLINNYKNVRAGKQYNNEQTTRAISDSHKLYSIFLENKTNTNNDFPTPFTDLDLKEMHDELVEDNVFSSEQAKVLCYLIMEMLNDNVYSVYNHKSISEAELDKVSLLLDSRVQNFELNKEREVEREKQNLDLAFDQLSQAISIMKDYGPHLIDNDLKRESQIDMKNHQNDINGWFEDLNLQLKNTRYLITVNVLGGLQVKVDEYRWMSMKHTVTAMALMILSLAYIIWPNNMFNKDKDNQPSVVLKSLENEVLDEDQVFENSKQGTDGDTAKDDKLNTNDSSNTPLQVIKPLSMEDLHELSQSEID
ncbi:uncharacterized protein HGUI_01450 [Hanseniaspora guilliermondii]|uniref:Uncharacterized protein n=1 Tax=Hanseniaspora guilliermondii TaxID=56406 RepID=A0A1L0AYP3_9ASCO|nr:uncharacterized protein HGUI_01450 [Hanseniaspora guilliermondii]